MPSMTEIGAGVLEKKMIDSNYKQTDLQTDYGRSEKVSWDFNLGYINSENRSQQLNGFS